MKLLNFSKPGKGVSKKQIKKRGVVRFFEIYFRAFWRFCSVNMWYFIVSLPVITCGLADAGIAYVARNTSMETPTFGTSDFFDMIKKNWKTALITGILNVAISGLLIFDWYYFFNQASGENELMNVILMAGIIFLFAMFTMMNFYIPLLTVTFRPKLMKLYKNSLVLTVAGIKRNLPILLLLCAIYGFVGWTLFVTQINLLLITVYIFMAIFIFPGFRAYLINYNAFIVVKDIMIDPYYAENPDADIEIRRSLGILEDDPEEDENVFSDDM